jgi:hypothetical protein
MVDYPVRLERKITCKTYLKRLHVTNRMAEMLLPSQEELTGKSGLANSQEYMLLFKVPVNIVDEEGYLWKVGCAVLRPPWECCRARAAAMAACRWLSPRPGEGGGEKGGQRAERSPGCPPLPPTPAVL